jgi:hypothetical protein
VNITVLGSEHERVINETFVWSDAAKVWIYLTWYTNGVSVWRCETTYKPIPLASARLIVRGCKRLGFLSKRHRTDQPLLNSTYPRPTDLAEAELFARQERRSRK